jgi:hypothetical protein
MKLTNFTQLDVDVNPDIPELSAPTDFGYNLYHEQKQVLWLMHELEQMESINVHQYCMNYNKIRLASCLSFGKTIVTLALIALKQPIKSRALYGYNLPYTKSMYILVKRPRRAKTTLVVVAAPVYSQWVESIKKTGLYCLYVDNITQFKTLCVLCHNDQISCYDMVLLKLRNLSMQIPGEFMQNTSPITILAKVTMDMQWDRVIIDDYDTIRLTKELSIPARMTWLVSATSHAVRAIKSQSIFSMSSINGHIMDASNDILINQLKITSMIKNTDVLAPQIKCIIYEFIYATVLNKVLNGLNDNTELSEMINSGAISNAMNALNITCDSIGDFLSRVLDKYKTAYKANMIIYRRFRQLVVAIKQSGRTMLKGDPEYENITIVDELYKIISTVCDTQFETLIEEIQTNTESFEDIKRLSHTANGQVSRCKNILERIKGNLEEGDCQKCYIEPEGDRYVLNCCHIIICEECFIHPDIRNPRKNVFITKCPNCSTKITREMILHVPAKLDIDTFIECDFNTSMNLVGDHQDQTIGKQLTLSTKMNAILDIVSGNEVTSKSSKTKYGLLLPMVMESDKYIDAAPNRQNKYIIFCRYAETTKEIANVLTSNGIPFARIVSRCNVDNAVSQFETTVNILLLTSDMICAGKNIQFATHVIFYHVMHDMHMTAQLIGRAQRIGRTESLQLIYLANDGETFNGIMERML